MARISDTDLILNPDGSVYHLGLLPEQLADTILAVGDPGRVEEVSRYFSHIDSRTHKREFITHTGTFNGKRISVISTGIGPDNVEIFFHEVDALVNIDLARREPRPVPRSLNIIRVGTSGAMQADVPVGSLVISDFAAGLDNLMSFYDLPHAADESAIAEALQRHTGLSFRPYVTQGSREWREKAGRGMLVGNTVTCPGFYAPQGRRVRTPIRYPDLLNDLGSFRHGDFRFTNFEMESSAYFAFGRLMGHHTASANAIIANRVRREFAKESHDVVDALIRRVLENV
ncbi:MAG: nucleoside phosphorylase [Cyclobacteriaceae bacterium]|nr:nucleoside phosphorylase [Cyclobacteriaceae bacterium]